MLTSQRVIRAYLPSILMAVVGVLFISTEWAFGQSTYDLEPPMQSETETNEILMSPDPIAIPTFTFAVASLNDGKIEITRSVANQEPIAVAATGNGIPYTENVIQNYTVQVPYTENVNGKPIQRMRTETRTRTVPVTRYRKRTPEEQKAFDEKMAKEGAKKSDEEQPMVKQITIPYVVKIPYVEHVDGKQVNRVRNETKTRIVSVTRGKTKTTAEVSKETYAIADIKSFGIDGRPLDSAEVKKRLAEKAAVILIKDPKAISPYFESLLKPGTMFMVRPE